MCTNGCQRDHHVDSGAIASINPLKKNLVPFYSTFQIYFPKMPLEKSVKICVQKSLFSVNFISVDAYQKYFDMVLELGTAVQKSGELAYPKDKNRQLDTLIQKVQTKSVSVQFREINCHKCPQLETHSSTMMEE